MTTTPDAGTALLEPAECWRLLRGAGRGRIAVVGGGSIDIVPVDFAVDGAALVFPTAPGAAPLELAVDDRIALETDGRDDAGRWSVVATGRAMRLERRSDIDRVEQLPIPPWPAALPRRWMRIVVDGVRGRRANESEEPPRRPEEETSSPRAAGAGHPSSTARGAAETRRAP